MGSASKLTKGERLKTPDGTLAVADRGSTPKQHDGWMWDLTVPGNNDHDFYVIPALTGHDAYQVEMGIPVLVHNSSRQLGCNLGAAGEQPETANPEAHHLVPENHPLAVGARAVLGRFGIDIDSSENGVWLSRATHQGTFTNSYVQWINDEIVNAGGS